ncbi:DNA repair protein RAD51 homolog 4 [Primulina eburnea]|uniref:DNA repair protein RAD51 homolog 4 n=1 Tax=Primulina eburnea TaxID=1245227 RepID=UPI003C6C0E48
MFRVFCLQAASNVAKKYSGMVVYFGSDNSVSPKRMHMTQLILDSESSLYPESRHNHVCRDSIVHYSVFDIYTLLDLLHQLLHDWKSQVFIQVRMLIIDSLSSLISPVVGGGFYTGHAIMVSAGFLLKELALEHNLSVLLTMYCSYISLLLRTKNQPSVERAASKCAVNVYICLFICCL